MELQILEGTAESIQSRIGLVETALTELRMASMTLQGLREEGKDAQLLVPVGGESYVMARVENAETIIFGIGAGVATQKPIEAAQKELENRVGEFEQMGVTLRQQLEHVATQLSGVRTRIEAISRRVSEGKGGVRET